MGTWNDAEEPRHFRQLIANSAAAEKLALSLSAAGGGSIASRSCRHNRKLIGLGEWLLSERVPLLRYIVCASSERSQLGTGSPSQFVEGVSWERDFTGDLASSAGVYGMLA